jgi:uncharacterized membrane protein YciS (DUF1049 family)
MRPIYWQTALAIIIVFGIIYVKMNNKITNLEEQLKKAEEKPAKPNNQTVANTAFKPVNPPT